ncbi:DUF5103 domain-containing protein [Tamlana sp. 2_MG-2023]|uniref:type IX secretion system plug protein n=1 Tax=unclassified Tamlana TaxID=2614803 RepID=UPI0026E2C441|nr:MULTISPECIES: DUF5103 domain-containing protein [unclassified Tamlana]MDO6758630.1 DUF5103 domain-containing protein [Tamlana sp. 2_MG-2023]MDO6789329.1 DUF5103 domain-containing protein [Tamlana sp. 1_MG-2023]
MRLKLTLNIIAFLLPVFLFAQVEETNPPDYIKTINFRSGTNENQLPILNMSDPIILEFDALNGNEDDFYYKIKYYNRDWTPSVLVQSEYLDGFDNQRIREYENSFNTYQIFSHYKLTIPNDQTRGLKVSGNYMIFIYDNNSELVFSRKFMLYENIANVGVVVKRTRDMESIEAKQRVELIVDSNRIQFNNPLQTVNAVIIQNNNLKTAITDIRPQYTLGNQLIYKYDSETSFWGGNEYFFFENKDVRGANNNIQFIDLQDLYHNYMYTNVSRVSQPYTYNPDINGNYVINNLDATNPDIEADYVWMHFSLKADNTIKDKNIHVYGSFNNYAIEEATKMSYDASKNIFSSSLLLKQGFYNYKYVVVNADGEIDEGYISGNHWQTENSYKVLVYYRDLGARYDRIIGYNEGSSVNISN